MVLRAKPRAVSCTSCVAEVFQFPVGASAMLHPVGAAELHVGEPLLRERTANADNACQLNPVTQQKGATLMAIARMHRSSNAGYMMYRNEMDKHSREGVG